MSLLMHEDTGNGPLMFLMSMILNVLSHGYVFFVVGLLAGAGTLPSRVSCDGGEQEPPVVEQSSNMFNNITLENFDQITKEKDIMLILFYVPWCPHSKAVQPEWEKASQVLEQQKQFVLGRCNCDGPGKTLCEEFKVLKYPNITLFRHGVYQESFEGRTAEAVIDFVQRAQSTDGFVGTTPPPAATLTIITQSPQQPLFQPTATIQRQQSPLESSTPQQEQAFGYNLGPQQPVVGALQQQQEIQGAYKQPQEVTMPPNRHHAGSPKIGPSLMSQYENVYKTKDMSAKFASQTEDRVNNVNYNSRYTQGQLKFSGREQKHTREMPKKQKLLSSDEVDEIKKYYEWKYATGR